MTKRKLIASFFIATTMMSCTQKATDNEERVYAISNDTVYVNSNLLSDKLKITEVSLEPFVKEVITAGTVQAIPTQFAYIAPPFGGRVIKSHIKLGQYVKANTPLFEIISPDFTSTQKEYFQAQSEKELAQKDLERKQDLLKNGVGSQKELEEALNLLKIAEKEYENAKAALNVYQINTKDMVLGQPLVVRSPISGDIIENNIVTGQYLNSESNHVAIVADLSKVWIVAQVKEKDIRFIHEGDDMNIHITALPGKSLKGTVYHIDEAVDEETRSIKVLSICENKDQMLKLGMYITVHFLDKPSDCITIPEKALLQDEKSSYVFVHIAESVFIKTPVETEGIKNGKTIVTSGLSLGDKIISEGGYYLK